MTVTGGDIVLNSEVELANPDEVLAHLTAKDAELDIEIKVERGLGYVPAEARTSEGDGSRSGRSRSTPFSRRSSM